MLHLIASPTDWSRVAFALELLDSTNLAGTISSRLATVARKSGTESVALAFPPLQASALQRVGQALGVNLAAASAVA